MEGSENEMKEKYEQIGDVRGLGMMQAIELVEDRESKTPACKLRDKVDELCMKRGLITLGCGKSGIRVIPPIITPIEQIDSGLDVFKLLDAAQELLMTEGFSGLRLEHVAARIPQVVVAALVLPLERIGQ